jgi:hypothetical protein
VSALLSFFALIGWGWPYWKKTEQEQLAAEGRPLRLGALCRRSRRGQQS